MASRAAGRKFGRMYKSPAIAYGFLLFVASYRIKSKYKEPDLYRLLIFASGYKANPQLCGVLGLAHRAEDLVQTLFKKGMLCVVDYVIAYNLTGKFPPVRLLKDHLNFVKRRDNKLSLQRDQAADEEIQVRAILGYIVKYNLESEYPKEELEKQISELNNKENLRVHQNTIVPIALVSDESVLVYAQVMVERSLKEDPKSDDQTQVKVEPSSKEDPKLGDQTQVKVEHSIPEKNSNIDKKAPFKGESSRRKSSKLESQAQVKGRRYWEKCSTVENQTRIAPVSDESVLVHAQVTAERSLKEDPKSNDQTQVKVEPSSKEDPKLGDQTRVKVEHSILEKNSNIHKKAPFKGESSRRKYSKLEGQAQVKGRRYWEKCSTVENQTRIPLVSDERGLVYAQVTVERFLKEDPKSYDQAQMKVEPSSKEDPKLGDQLQVKVEHSIPEKNSNIDIKAPFKDESSRRKSSTLEGQAQVKGGRYWEKCSTVENQTRVKAKPLTKKDPNVHNKAKVMVKSSDLLGEDPNLGNKAQVIKVDASPKEYLELNNRAKKVESSSEDKRESENRGENTSKKDSLSSTSHWPSLGSLCASIYGKGLFLLARKDKKELSSSAHSFSSSSRELKSFCANMDGKTMRTFFYDHVEDQHLLQDALREILTCVLDPAKLAFDAMSGFSDSDLELDESLSFEKVVYSRILLLEQLNTIFPEISPGLKEESQKIANEWRENLGKMHEAPSNVYGFLLFIAAYGLVSNYEVNELLGLLLRANYHKATPSLCRMLRLQIDDVSVLIQNLEQDDLPLEAIEHVYEYELTSKFRPVRLLKYGLHATPRDATNLPSENVIDRKLAAAKRFRDFIEKFKLEPGFTREDLEKYITELESHKVNISNANTLKFASLSYLMNVKKHKQC